MEDYLKICLDAGHGGTDPGASGNGLQEKNITLDIVKRIAEGLKAYKDVTVIETRPEDKFVELSTRAKISNDAKADLFLSVHINSGASSARGFESHIYTNVDAGTKAYQNVMHEEIYNKAYKPQNVPDRGKRQSNFAVVRETNCKAILTENLFTSNSADAKLLASPDFRQTIAEGHINGLVKFLGLQKAKPPTTDPAPAPAPGGKLWKVQVGAFEDEKTARDLAVDLTKQGYRPYVYKE